MSASFAIRRHALPTAARCHQRLPHTRPFATSSCQLAYTSPYRSAPTSTSYAGSRPPAGKTETPSASRGAPSAPSYKPGSAAGSATAAQSQTAASSPTSGATSESSAPVAARQTPAASGDDVHTVDLSKGLSDAPPAHLAAASNDASSSGASTVDWARSYHGLSTEAFSSEAAQILMAPIAPEDVEVKPDGIVYLPEIKYRRILNRAFGPGAWGLAPRGETMVTSKAVTREYALVVHGRLVSVARGEQDYFSPDSIPTATEGCKSNALVRCCKDIGIASELWDPRFIREWQRDHARQVWAEHPSTKRRKLLWTRKDAGVPAPYVEIKGTGGR